MGLGAIGAMDDMIQCEAVQRYDNETLTARMCRGRRPADTQDRNQT